MEPPPKWRAQRCRACGLVSPASAVRCECGAIFTGGVPAVSAMSAAKLTKQAWGNAIGALFFVVVFGATSILLTVHAVWPLARTLFGIAAGVALVGAAWGFTRIPRDQRRRSAVPWRGVLAIGVMSAAFVGVIAYGLHDYLSTTFPVGHDCTTDRECRSSHCFQQFMAGPGVCTEYCDSDADCPEHMMCTAGVALRPGESPAFGGGTKVHFCKLGTRAAPP